MRWPSEEVRFTACWHCDTFLSPPRPPSRPHHMNDTSTGCDCTGFFPSQDQRIGARQQQLPAAGPQPLTLTWRLMLWMWTEGSRGRAGEEQEVWKLLLRERWGEQAGAEAGWRLWRLIRAGGRRAGVAALPPPSPSLFIPTSTSFSSSPPSGGILSLRTSACWQKYCKLRVISHRIVNLSTPSPSPRRERLRFIIINLSNAVQTFRWVHFLQ